MIDMETMAFSPTAVVLSLGAVHFNPYGNGYGDKIYFKIDLDDQDKLNREIDPNTLEWWGKQDPAIMEEAFSEEGRIPLVDAMDQFHKFAWGCDAFWSHGSIFDLNILDTYYRKLNKAPPWNYWQIRDTRTLFDIGKVKLTDGGYSTSHKALEDCDRQVAVVEMAYKKLMAVGLGQK